MLLARCLPHAAASSLGAACGRVAGRLSGNPRRRALVNLRAAFPDLEEERLAEIARDAFAYRWSAIFAGASACRFDSRSLCRRLTLSGWSRLDAAESRDLGVFVLGAGFGSWQFAALAVALYRGPIETPGPWRSDPVFSRLAMGFERRSGRRLFGQTEQQLEWTVRAGDRVGFLADQAAGHGEAIDVPFLGRTIRAKTLVARTSIDTGAPVVPVFGRPRPPESWSVEVREPIHPAAADAETLTARYLEAIENEIRQRPELWLGWWSPHL